MLIGTRCIINVKLTAEPLRVDLEISRALLEQKSSVEYSVVHIEDSIKALASTVTRTIAMIRYSKKFISKHTLRMLHRGLVEPHFSFTAAL